MSNTILEMLRTKHEEIELLDKAIAKAISFKETNPKESVTADLIIKRFIDDIKQRSKEILEIYTDSDGTRKEEIDILGGNKNLNPQDITRTPDVWNNYYDKIREIKVLNKNLHNSTELIENNTPEKIFNAVFEQITSKSIFSAEENKGKCVDMHDLFMNYQNLKKLRDLKIAEDYLTFLSEFDKFEGIPLQIKKAQKYKEYVASIVEYLKKFYERSHPLTDYNEINQKIDDQFESEWKQGSLIGWESILKRLRNSDKENTEEFNHLFCVPCDKLFSNEHTFEHHKKGKHHVKLVNRIAEKMNEEFKEKALSDINPKEEKECKEIALKEYQVRGYSGLLYDIIENSRNQIRKKQSRNYHEMEIEILDSKVVNAQDSDSDDDKPIYNPKNVPLGWDGKPIPYWLYKLHGLGIEYKCEICGGASYWGRRAFERHFQEWRHSYGMKCLKIPNTIHFKDVTGIEDALRLYQKLQEDNSKVNFKPEAEEEFEDSEGNVVSKKMYLDLKRQGLL